MYYRNERLRDKNNPHFVHLHDEIGHCFLVENVELSDAQIEDLLVQAELSRALLGHFFIKAAQNVCATTCIRNNSERALITC